MSTFLENTQKLVDEASRIAKIPADLLVRLQQPDHVWEFEIAVRMDPVRSQSSEATAVAPVAQRVSNGVDDGTEKKFRA